MEKWENRKYLVFPHVCLVGGMEKWESGKLFCLFEKNFCLVEKKKWKDRKCSLHKLTIIPLLHNR